MYTGKAIKYTLEVPGGIKELALAALHFTSLQGTEDARILDIETDKKENRLYVSTTLDIEDTIGYYGRVIYKEPLAVLPVTIYNLPDKYRNKIDELTEDRQLFIMDYQYKGNY